MADIEWLTDPPRASLRRAIRHRVRGLTPPCRVIAENFLALESRMDLLGVGGAGELVSLRIGGRGDDRDLLTRSLSDLAWLRSRAEDLSKLVPDLGIEPTAGARAMLFCSEFSSDARAAAQWLPVGSVELLAMRCYRERGQLNLVLEAIPIHRDRSDPEGIPSATARPSPDPRAASPAPGMAPAGRFRTGLREADLRLPT